MLEREEEGQEIENLFEKIMKENVPNLVKEIGTQPQEAQRVRNKMDTKRITPRHIIMQKVKERIFTSSKRKADSKQQRIVS